jgi:hypothetical protein
MRRQPSKTSAKEDPPPRTGGVGVAPESRGLNDMRPQLKSPELLQALWALICRKQSEKQRTPEFDFDGLFSVYNLPECGSEDELRGCRH